MRGSKKVKRDEHRGIYKKIIKKVRERTKNGRVQMKKVMQGRVNEIYRGKDLGRRRSGIIKKGNKKREKMEEKDKRKNRGKKKKVRSDKIKDNEKWGEITWRGKRMESNEERRNIWREMMKR